MMISVARCFAVVLWLFAASAHADQILPGVDLQRGSASRHFEIWQSSEVRWQPSEQSLFLRQLEDAYTKATAIFSDPRSNSERLSRLIQVGILSGRELVSSGKTAKIERTGYFSPEVFDRKNRDMIFLTVDQGLNAELIHRAVHEIQHLFLYTTHRDEDVWVNEGLSELLAWRVTRLVPSVATEAFLDVPTAPPLQGRAAVDFDYADYGQSYLLMRFIWEHGAGDAIFQAIAAQPGRGISAVVSALSQIGHTFSRGFPEIYEDFLISLLFPAGSSQSEYAWRTQKFIKIPRGDNQGLLPPGFSFTLLDRTSLDCVPQIQVQSAAQSYFVQLGGGMLRISETQKASIQESDPIDPSKRSYLLIINESASSAEYDAGTGCR